MVTYKQYQVVIVNLGITIGSEVRKTRPCVIISPDEINRYLPRVVIVPMTTKRFDIPTRVPVRWKKRNGWLMVDQIRTIDRKRVISGYEKLKPDEIARLKSIIKETYVD